MHHQRHRISHLFLCTNLQKGQKMPIYRLNLLKECSLVAMDTGMVNTN